MYVLFILKNENKIHDFIPFSKIFNEFCLLNFKITFTKQILQGIKIVYISLNVIEVDRNFI